MLYGTLTSQACLYGDHEEYFHEQLIEVNISSKILIHGLFQPSVYTFPSYSSSSFIMLCRISFKQKQTIERRYSLQEKTMGKKKKDKILLEGYMIQTCGQFCYFCSPKEVKVIFHHKLTIARFAHMALALRDCVHTHS